MQWWAAATRFVIQYAHDHNHIFIGSRKKNPVGFPLSHLRFASTNRSVKITIKIWSSSSEHNSGRNHKKIFQLTLDECCQFRKIALKFSIHILQGGETKIWGVIGFHQLYFFLLIKLTVRNQKLSWVKVSKTRKNQKLVKYFLFSVPQYVTKEHFNDFYLSRYVTRSHTHQCQLDDSSTNAIG